jgi:hypothetical protein
LPVADEHYQWKTGVIHGGLALACLLATAYNYLRGRSDLVTGFVLTGVTNAWIAWEKFDLIRRGKP